MSSYFPSTMSLKLRTVSSIFTYFPSRPVNCAATNMGCERNFSILRARATVRLSSSESSSIPRMAMMSWRSLSRCKIDFTPHETENVIDEQEHIEMLLVPEIFGDGEAGEAHAQTRAGRLGHLPVDQRGARLLRIAGHDHAALGHFQPQVVALAGALAHACEYRDATVLHGHVVNELHNQNGLADTRAAEQTNLATLHIGLDQIDDLDSGFKHFQL